MSQILIFLKANIPLPNSCSYKEPHNKVCPSILSVPTPLIIKLCRKDSECIQKYYFASFAHPTYFTVRCIGARLLQTAYLTAFIRKQRRVYRLHLSNLSQRLNLASLQICINSIAAINHASLFLR